MIALFAGRALGAQVPGELRGHVLDARTGQPIAAARVEVVGQDEFARSGVDGTFVIHGLEPRTYAVRARAFGHAMRERSFELSNGRTTTLDLALEPLPTELDAVVVRGPRQGAAMPAAEFDRGAIEQSGRRDVGELLASAPGVVITRMGGAGASSRASIRGSGANEVLVLLDGVALNSEITGEADLSRINLESVDRVTVLTGAQSSRYGGRALAGVIDIRSRRAMNDLSALGRTGTWGEREGSATMASSTRLTHQTLGATFTTDVRHIDGNFAYDVPAFRGGGTARRENSDMESRQALGALSFDAANASAALRASWEHMTRGLAGSIVQPSATGREQLARGTIGADGGWNRGPLAWTIAGDVAREDTRVSDPAPPFGVPYDDTVRATASRLSTTLTARHASLVAVLGTEARSLGVRATELASTAPHWQRILGAWSQLRATHLIGDDGTELGGDVGVRVDETSLDGEAVISPRAMVSVARSNVSASMSVGAGYAPPTLADQFFHEGVLVRANPSLKPERTRGDVEARLSVRPLRMGPALISGEAAVFRANIDGMILWLPDFRYIWSPSNYAVHRAGWEMTARAATSSGVAEVTGTLNDAAVTYAGGVFDGQVAYRPRTTAHLTAALNLFRAGLELSNDYVGARRTVPGSALNSLSLYWLTGARISHTIDRASWAADVALGVDNIFTRPAAMLVDYPFPSRSWTLSVRVRRPNGRSTP